LSRKEFKPSIQIIAMIIVSACLAGENCRFDGKSKPCQKVVNLVKAKKAIPVCPEQLGGLGIPRGPFEILNEKVITKDGKDFTSQFEQGAQEALRIALDNKCDQAILKSRSPSCGSNRIYDGTFSNTLVNGNGVFATLLKKNNINIQTEEEI
jgi:uncharacterized protein YbbK (DUF523 family)